MEAKHSSSVGRGEAEVLPCRLCKRSYRRITGSHLYWKHDLETDDYRERFPNAPFFAEENKRELSQSIIRSWERIGRHWTKERVRRTIRTLKSQRRPLHAMDVKKRFLHLSLDRWPHRRLGTFLPPIDQVFIHPIEGLLNSG